MTQTPVKLLVIGLVALVGCRKQTPVDEVSLSQSGVVVSERDFSDLAGQWPQWRGPNGDGISDAQPLPTTWDDATNVVWKSDVPGRGHSSPIVVGDLVVVGSAIDSKSEQIVVAYDRETGDQRWQTTVHKGGFPSDRDVHHKATNANGTLASDGDLLVTAHLNSQRVFVTALDLEGNQVWQRDIGAFASKFGYAPSPVLYKSLVIIAADNFGGGYLVGMDLKSGEIAWRTKRGNASSYSSPHVATVGGVDQVLISGGDRLASYDPATGEELWETQCIAEATCGTVVTTDDRIFAAGGYPEKETVCLSAKGERIWSDRTKVYEPSLITDGEHVFAVNDDGIALCWSAEDGTIRWKKRLGGSFSSSPVLCNGNVYAADLSGNTYVFQASGDEYRQVAKNRLGDDCYASPAIVDGSIYLRVGIGDGNERREQLVRIGTAE
ncbi:outer membrane biogenesis protein BamB [Stieleria maiorica]|uniref:Outer membrane biogenesis protein BamB n=1 Tax=Stieleria maiorica TaxID=2795974 RepID=A0A5B9MJV2_9BACT|nr:PQQ-binding-like beta-propeller repeat protein [Stieleria maiorica]QEG00307.1 outer membrane biogenesis protein BamB [Stieleria maiorica]